MFVFVILLSAASAADLSVCDDGCDSATIQDAVDMSSDGDRIWISAGTYSESVTIEHSVSLLADAAIMGTVTIEGDGSSFLLEVTAEGDAQVHRIDFSGGGGQASIVNRGTLRLADSVISDSDATYGGILNIGALRLRDSLVVGNHGDDYAGGISSFGELEVNGCTFLANDGLRGGGLSSTSGELVVRDSLFAANEADIGGAIHNRSGVAVLSDLAFTDNYASIRGGGWSNQRGTIIVESPNYTKNNTGSGHYQDCHNPGGRCR